MHFTNFVQGFVHRPPADLHLYSLKDLLKDLLYIHDSLKDSLKDFPYSHDSLEDSLKDLLYIQVQSTSTKYKV